MTISYNAQMRLEKSGDLQTRVEAAIKRLANAWAATRPVGAAPEFAALSPEDKLILNGIIRTGRRDPSKQAREIVAQMVATVGPDTFGALLESIPTVSDGGLDVPDTRHVSDAQIAQAVNAAIIVFIGLEKSPPAPEEPAQ